MRDRPELTLAAVVAVGLLVLLGVGLTDRRDEAFSLGVRPAGVAAELRQGDRACEERVDASEDFSSVELQVGTYRRAGSPLELTVLEGTAAGRRLGAGTLPGGYPDVSRQRVEVGQIAAGRQVAVCVENRGPRKVALYGNAGIAAPFATLRVSGRPVDADLTLVFHRAEQRSLIAALPDALRHAALFKAGWVGAWTFWLLALAVVGLAPLVLVLAVRGSRGDAPG
jgi:hypothetical protein